MVSRRVMGMLVIDIKHDPQVSSCPFILYDELDFLLEIPILTLLAFNFLFLLWVIIVSSIYATLDILIVTLPFQIVVSKLNQQTVRLDHERRHFKAAKVCSIFIDIYKYVSR